MTRDLGLKRRVYYDDGLRADIDLFVSFECQQLDFFAAVCGDEHTCVGEWEIVADQENCTVIGSRRLVQINGLKG